jgi:hypothetical protein
MIKELIRAASQLDRFGLSKEADVVDQIIRKIASRESGAGDYGIYHMSQADGGYYLVTWFDSLEEAQKELNSGYYQIDGGDLPYIVMKLK